MYYIADNYIKKSFLAMRDKISNSFFGILGILYCAEGEIAPLKTYKIPCTNLYIWLTEQFSLGKKEAAKTTENLYVRFSESWETYVAENMFSDNISILDLAIFIYKKKAFEKPLSCSELIDLFKREYRITASIANEWFNGPNNDINLDWQEEKRNNTQLREALGLNPYEESRPLTTISFSSPYLLKAEPYNISAAPFIQTLYASIDTVKCLIMSKESIDYLYPNQYSGVKRPSFEGPLQIIYYGAPGTGKSHTTDLIVRDFPNSHQRTTFHPDTDYSSFVGCYKPSKEHKTVSTAILPLDKLIDKLRHIKEDGETYPCHRFAAKYWASVEGLKKSDIEHLLSECGFESSMYQEIKKGIAVGKYTNPKVEDGKLTYKFVPQVFLKAYVEAWRNPALPYFLVIEEINRGNCAQIFGDIFQLLDRDKANGGISKYTITPDEDIRKYLEETFAADDFEHLPDLLRLGEHMQLPGNLYILATMNTSDQSLFPIDSAFKRRWAWKYKPIEQGRDKEGKPYEWQIRNGNYAYDWWEFISKINEKIEDATQSEDKKMGFWFTSPEKGVGYITLEDFISKVLFYLWNDVYKDLAKTDETIFKGQPLKAEGATEEPKAYEIFFTHFFRTDGSVENRVRDFMRFNGITEKEFVDPTPKGDDAETDGEDEDDGPSPDNKAHWEAFVKALAGTSIAEKVDLAKLAIPEVRTFELKCSDLPDCKVGASIATKKGYLRVYFWSGGNNQDIIRPIIEEDKDAILQQLSEATNSTVKICGKKVLTIEATDDSMSTEWQANAFAAFYDFFTDLLSDYQAGDTPNTKEKHQQFWNRMQDAFVDDEILQGGRMMREGYGYFIPSFGREDVGIRVYHTMHTGRNGYGVGVHVLPNGAQSLKDTIKQGVEQVNTAFGQEANVKDNYSGVKVFYPADEFSKVDLSTDENEAKAFDNIKAIAHKLYEAFKPIIDQYQG